MLEELQEESKREEERINYDVNLCVCIFTWKSITRTHSWNEPRKITDHERLTHLCFKNYAFIPKEKGHK